MCIRLSTRCIEEARSGQARSSKGSSRPTDRQFTTSKNQPSPAQPSPAQILYRLFFLTLYKDEATYKKKLIPHNVLATVQMATDYRLQTIGRLQTRIGQVYRSRGKERVGSAKTRRPPYFILFFLGTFRAGPSSFFSFFFIRYGTVPYGYIYLGIFPDFPVSSDEFNECAYLPECTCIHDVTTWTLT